MHDFAVPWTSNCPRTPKCNKPAENENMRLSIMIKFCLGPTVDQLKVKYGSL